VNDHKHTNNLINETSPYLLATRAQSGRLVSVGLKRRWGKARAENKPISSASVIPRVTGCHVMEHESFENEDIARLITRIS